MNVPNATGARILVEQLHRLGVDRIFCVPGESFLAVLDALLDYPTISVITCRHEGGAAMMAEAHGKLTGRPGVAFVTRGPGATNASAGIHIAHQDSTPMILFVGQIERSATERGAFQEIDIRAMFSPLSKWATQIEDPSRIPEIVSRSFRVSMAGRPGPVVIALPEDMLTERVTCPGFSSVFEAVQPQLTAEAAEEIGQALRSARNPILVVGGGGWTPRTAQDAARFAQDWNIPIVASFRCQDYVSNDHPNYVGNLGLGVNPMLTSAIRESDLIVAVGARLGEVSSNGYTLLDIPVPAQNMIHVNGDSAELGRVYQPTLAFNAGSESTFKRLVRLTPSTNDGRAARVTTLRRGYETWSTPPSVPGVMQPGQIMSYLRRRLRDDTIVTNGAGNFAIWPNRYHRYVGYRTMLAPRSGTMGYGFPAALAAKLCYPERMVVAFCGDGDFLMTGQELATAVRENLAVLVLLFNNNMYGTIRMHQESKYPERISATELTNPDFAQLARSYGAYGERVDRTEDFAAAFERAVAAQRPAILEISLDQEVITPTATITSIRENSRS